MKTKNLFKTCAGFVVLALAFCLNSCLEEDPFPGEPVSEGLAFRSVQFYFTNVSDGQLQSVYEFCDEDGCCHTPAEKVDTFRLVSGHLYFCSIKMNGDNSTELLAGTGENAQQFSFSYNPQVGLDLMIEQPDMGNMKYSDLRTNWRTGQPGNGLVNFRIRYCPLSIGESQCYDISLPVVIQSSEDID